MTGQSLKLGKFLRLVISDDWALVRPLLVASGCQQTCQGAETFKGETFTFGKFLKVPPTIGWAGKKILISRSSKTPIFAFLLCNF